MVLKRVAFMACRTGLSPMGDQYFSPPSVWPAAKSSAMIDEIRSHNVVDIYTPRGHLIAAILVNSTRCSRSREYTPRSIVLANQGVLLRGLERGAEGPVRRLPNFVHVPYEIGRA